MAAIAGGVGGGVGGLILLALLLFCCCGGRKKKKDRAEPFDYDENPWSPAIAATGGAAAGAAATGSPSKLNRSRTYGAANSPRTSRTSEMAAVAGAAGIGAGALAAKKSKTKRPADEQFDYYNSAQVPYRSTTPFSESSAGGLAGVGVTGAAAGAGAGGLGRAASGYTAQGGRYGAPSQRQSYRAELNNDPYGGIEDNGAGGGGWAVANEMRQNESSNGQAGFAGVGASRNSYSGHPYNNQVPPSIPYQPTPQQNNFYTPLDPPNSNRFGGNNNPGSPTPSHRSIPALGALGGGSYGQDDSRGMGQLRVMNQVQEEDDEEQRRFGGNGGAYNDLTQGLDRVHGRYSGNYNGR